MVFLVTLWMVVLVLVASCSGQGLWEVKPNQDNDQNHDMYLTPWWYEVTDMMNLCAQLPYCAGFSSAFYRLKWSLSNLGTENGTSLFIKVPAPPPLPAPPVINVWPIPSNFSTGYQKLTLDSNSFSINCVGSCGEVISSAISRYYQFTFPIEPQAVDVNNVINDNELDSGEFSLSASFLSGLDIYLSTTTTIANASSEAYELVVPSSPNGKATLTAATEEGLLRGLETFSQLVDITPEGVYSVSNLPLQISDSPRYQIRSLMVDSGRDFISVPKILQILEGMAASKINVFHWHLTDDQSFPFQSKVYPLLWQKGAFNNKKAVYSYDDIHTVLEYARLRGIRVIPEFDMPAHSQSWTLGYPFLQGSCICPMLDPTLESTYTFVDKFLGEVVALFPDHVLHLGGDEVRYPCWNSTEINAWMKDHNMTNDFVALESYWLGRVHSIVSKYNRTMMLWHDSFANGATVPKGTIIGIWGGGEAMISSVMKAGFQTVYAQPFYLDVETNGWDNLYATAGIPQPSDLFLGGEACMWGENTDDTNIVPNIFPRAAAFSELFWSPDEVPKIASFATNRFLRWRCRALIHEVDAAPIGFLAVLNYYPFYYCNPL